MTQIVMRYSNSIHIIILTALVMSACREPPVKPGYSRESKLADIYNPGRTSLHPDFSVTHINDSLSLLYVRVSTAELLFSEANEEGVPRGRLRISYELRRLEENIPAGVLSDSASIVKFLYRSEVRQSFFTGLPLKSVIGRKYFLIINVHDELRKTRRQSTLIVDKTSRFAAQNYKITTPRGEIPVFTNFLNSEQAFRLKFNQMGFDSIYVDYYSPDRSLPRPVFSSLPETPLKNYPDSAWVYPLTDSLLYLLPTPGLYIFKVNKSLREGLTLTNFGDNFPQINTVDDMLGPLVYLTSSMEFRDLRMQQNRKLAVDNFWLNAAGNADAARELIKVYYNRVYFANLYFTSYKEGWKTDRGMIYIIFGTPNKLETDAVREKWTYLTGRSTNPLEFVFERKENIFTNQDYQSVREVSSNPFWRNAVQSWRKGKIYSTIN